MRSKSFGLPSRDSRNVTGSFLIAAGDGPPAAVLPLPPENAFFHLETRLVDVARFINASLHKLKLKAGTALAGNCFQLARRRHDNKNTFVM
jgi:hypothetical protein